jgi:DNA-binding GntR family transcriptional regulator
MHLQHPHIAMSRPSTVFKRTTNRMVDFVANNVTVGAFLPSEQHLADVCLASRTAVRSAFAHLQGQRLIRRDGRRFRLLRIPMPRDGFEVEELLTGTDRVRQVLMERVFNKDMPPGSEFSESELARAAGTGTVSVREFLIGFSRSSLIEKKPRGGWRLCAFDAAFGEELADIRMLFEIAAIRRFSELAPVDPAWGEVTRLIARHEALRPKMARQFAEFPTLDRELHGFLINVLDNRFARSFYDAISFVFHYHYQWDKRGERDRNSHALAQHLALLRALADRDVPAALVCLKEHLETARRTMLAAIQTRDQGMAPPP